MKIKTEGNTIKKIQNSSVIMLVFVIYLVFMAVTYELFQENIKAKHAQETKILFYKIQLHTSKLLSNLLYQYTQDKEKILTKHKEVFALLKKVKEPLTVDLSFLCEPPYNVYITNKDLVITNTTFQKDKGFDLSFAKDIFDRHFNEEKVGLSTPLFEISSKQFFSYTDEYLIDSQGEKLGIVQVSYVYKDSSLELKSIQKLLEKYPSIVDAKAYIMVDSGFISDIILKDFSSDKPDLKEVIRREKEGHIVASKLKNDEFLVQEIQKDEKSYSELYLSVESAIFDNTRIVYSILMDNSGLDRQLEKLNISMLFLLFISFSALLIMLRLRRKEIKLSEQDKFIQSSMHEIKTPLSVITLNNELRELEFGRDEYTQEIDSAIKVLKTSYDDMSYTMTKDSLSYPVELLELEAILLERAEYFKSIASSSSKQIYLTIESACFVRISQVELIRLIDNNLSNAVKYSDKETKIEVVLKESSLSFKSQGALIKDVDKIFEKYVRENSVVGGHGLGLNIVHEICQKYEIDITVTSESKKGNIFEYSFKCHKCDI